MSTKMYKKKHFTEAAHVGEFAPRRGWPVVATGERAVADLVGYLQWRQLLDLPEETTDFSDRDVFDVVEWALARFAGRDSHPLAVKLSQRGAEALSDMELSELHELELRRRRRERLRLLRSRHGAASPAPLAVDFAPTPTAC